jgi:uncharacterized protein
MSNANTAMITGASAGIGAVYADRLARRGHELILVARDQARLNALAVRLRAETGRAVEIMTADPAARPDLLRVERRLAQDPSITTLVNNAGVDIAAMPENMLMDVDEMVDAALAGLDIGEMVTIPSLPDLADWSRFNDARLAMGPNLSRAHAARRYMRVGEAA